MAEIPEKPYYKLNEVCQYTDTQPYVLRFWESEFPQLNPEKGRSGQPIYRRRDIDLVLRIKQLLQDDEQSIPEARELLESEADGRPVVADAAPVSDLDEPADWAPPPATPTAMVAPEPEAVSVDDMVPRHRYDDAVDEIQHLKLELADAQQRLRKAETAQRKHDEANTRLRERNHRAAAILEGLIERLT